MPAGRCRISALPFISVRKLSSPSFAGIRYPSGVSIVRTVFPFLFFRVKSTPCMGSPFSAFTFSRVRQVGSSVISVSPLILPFSSTVNRNVS